MKSVLTLSQKKQVIEERDRRAREGISTKQSDLVAWTKSRFSLPVAPDQSTISRILRDRANILSAKPSVRVRNRKARVGLVDDALADWVRDRFSRGAEVSAVLIREKGQMLLKKANSRLSSQENLSFKFSNGWLQKFQLRHGFSSIKSQGVSSDADAKAMARTLPELSSRLRGYNDAQIYNADEFGIYYKMAPDKAIAEKMLAGKKKDEIRLTVLACVNADGSHKLPLQIIGKSRHPSFFGKKSEELGFDYRYNTSAWMTPNVFNEWLLSFDASIASSHGKKVALLIDNCSVHGRPNTLPSLSFVDVIYLPLDTTSILQPLDAGITTALKAKYKLRQLRRALDMSEMHQDNVYCVNQLTGMNWLKQEWENISEDTIISCWRRTKIRADGRSTDEVKVDTDQVHIELGRIIEQLVPAARRMSVGHLFNLPNEGDCLANITNEYLVDMVLDSDKDSEVQTEEGDGVHISLDDQTKALATVSWLLDHRNIDCKHTRVSVREMQSSLRNERRRKKK